MQREGKCRLCIVYMDSLSGHERKNMRGLLYKGEIESGAGTVMDNNRIVYYWEYTREHQDHRFSPRVFAKSHN